MTKDILGTPCFVNSDKGEISSDFGIVRSSRASKGTFNHSKPMFTVLQGIMYCGYNQPRRRIRYCEQQRGRNRSHFRRQNAGSSHSLLRICFRKDCALGPISLASLSKQCILFSFSFFLVYYCIYPPRTLLQNTQLRLQLEFLFPLRKNLH